MAKQTNALEITVSELSFSLKKAVEDQFGHVRVRGEISGYRGPHASGHSYFSLKDDKAKLEAVIWRGVSSRLKHMPEEGLEVIASGKLTTYPGSSKYQIVIDNLEAAGAGALMALLEERKKKLAAEGLFGEERKQLLPYLPKVIGVITSPTGAVIRDVLHRIADRYALHVLVWPVRVQGETCGAEVSNAIRGFNALSPTGDIPQPDIIIVARGGGSVEDLWGFNDESVVRAAAASDIPLISAVGHETDWTLLDHVADLRAPTPTGAAEIAVRVKSELELKLTTLANRLTNAVQRALETPRNELRAAERGLDSPQALLDFHQQRFDGASARLVQGLALATSGKRTSFERIAGRLNWRGLTRTLEVGKERLGQIAKSGDLAWANNSEKLSTQLDQVTRLLKSLSHQNILERGFALIRDGQGQMITSAAGIKPNTPISVLMKDGEISAVTGIRNLTETKKKSAKEGKPSAMRKLPSEQGNLF